MTAARVVRRGRVRRLALLFAIGLAGGSTAGGAGPLVVVEPLQARGPVGVSTARNLLSPYLGRISSCVAHAGAASLRTRRFVVRMYVAASPVRHRMIYPELDVAPDAVVDQPLRGCVLDVLGQVRFPAAMSSSTIWVEIRITAAAAPPRAAANPRLLVTGKVVNAANGSPLGGATVLVLQPWVRAADLDLEDLEEKVAAVAITSSSGRFQGSPPLPRGFGYGLVVVARGFEPASLASGALRSPSGASTLDLGTIELRRRRW